MTTGKPWGTRLPVCDTSTSCRKSNKERQQLKRELAVLRHAGRRRGPRGLVAYLVLTDALVPQPLVEDLVFEGPRAAHHALLDVGDGGGVLHNLNHSCNVNNDKCPVSASWKAQRNAAIGVGVRGRRPILLPVEMQPYGSRQRSRDSVSQMDSMISRI